MGTDSFRRVRTTHRFPPAGDALAVRDTHPTTAGGRRTERDNRVKAAVILCVLCLILPAASLARTIYVANDGPADFRTIQAAIDDANDGDTVLVAPGTYTGDGNRDIDFKGKAITVRSKNGPGTCVIDAQGTAKKWRRGFYFHEGEQADSVLDGFTITGGIQYVYSGGGIACIRSSPTIRNCVIVGNAAPEGGGLDLGDSSAVVSNCIIAGNRTLSVGSSLMLGGGLICGSDGHVILRNCTIYANRAGTGGGVQAGLGRKGKISLVNCILFGNRAKSDGNQISRAPTNMVVPAIGVEIRDCLIEDDPNALGGSVHLSDLIDCIWGDPLFANPGHWDSDLTPTSWIDGDYHLKSRAGRWDPNNVGWVQDDLTSPCIDAGDPNSPIGNEPFPNGGRINMGAYGGTAEASKSYFGEPPCETIIAGDINGDCRVDFEDLALLAGHWLQGLPHEANEPHVPPAGRPPKGTVGLIGKQRGVEP